MIEPFVLKITLPRLDFEACEQMLARLISMPEGKPSPAPGHGRGGWGQDMLSGGCEFADGSTVL